MERAWVDLDVAGMVSAGVAVSTIDDGTMEGGKANSIPVSPKIPALSADRADALDPERRMGSPSR